MPQVDLPEDIDRPIRIFAGMCRRYPHVDSCLMKGTTPHRVALVHHDQDREGQNCDQSALLFPRYLKSESLDLAEEGGLVDTQGLCRLRAIPVVATKSIH